MSVMVSEVYDALRKAGVDEPSARQAAEAVLGSSVDVATKSDLRLGMDDLRVEMAGIRTEMADLKVELIKWNVGAMAVLTGIFAAIVRLG